MTFEVLIPVPLPEWLLDPIADALFHPALNRLGDAYMHATKVHRRIPLWWTWIGYMR